MSSSLPIRQAEKTYAKSGVRITKNLPNLGPKSVFRIEIGQKSPDKICENFEISDAGSSCIRRGPAETLKNEYYLQDSEIRDKFHIALRLGENLKLSNMSLLQLNMNAKIFEESVASFHNHNSIETRYFLSACTSRQEELPKISGTQYGWGHDRSPLSESGAPWNSVLLWRCLMCRQTLISFLSLPLLPRYSVYIHSLLYYVTYMG